MECAQVHHLQGSKCLKVSTFQSIIINQYHCVPWCCAHILVTLDTSHARSLGVVPLPRAMPLVCCHSWCRLRETADARGEWFVGRLVGLQLEMWPSISYHMLSQCLQQYSRITTQMEVQVTIKDTLLSTSPTNCRTFCIFGPCPWPSCRTEHRPAGWTLSSWIMTLVVTGEMLHFWGIESPKQLACQWT